LRKFKAKIGKLYMKFKPKINGFLVIEKSSGAKGNCPPVANLLFAPSGPSFLLSVHPWTLALQSLSAL
jgi:hypothetical protein